MPSSALLTPDENLERQHLSDRVSGSDDKKIESRYDRVKIDLQRLKASSQGLGVKLEKKFKSFVENEEMIKKLMEGNDREKLEELRRLDRFLAIVLTKVEMRQLAEKGLKDLPDGPAKELGTKVFEDKLSEFEDRLDANAENVEDYDITLQRMEQMAREFSGYGSAIQVLMQGGHDSFENADPLADQTIVYDRNGGKTDEFAYWYRNKTEGGKTYPVLFCFDKNKQRTMKLDPLSCFKHFGGKDLIAGEKWGENAWVYVDFRPSEYGDRFNGEKLLDDEEKKTLIPDGQKKLIEARTKVLEDSFSAEDKFGTHTWNMKWNLNDEQKTDARERQRQTLKYMKGEERGFYDHAQAEEKTWARRKKIRNYNLELFEGAYQHKNGEYGAKGVDGWKWAKMGIDEELLRKPEIVVDNTPAGLFINFSQDCRKRKALMCANSNLRARADAENTDTVEISTRVGGILLARLHVGEGGEVEAKDLQEEKKYQDCFTATLEDDIIRLEQKKPLILNTKIYLDEDSWRHSKLDVLFPAKPGENNSQVRELSLDPYYELDGNFNVLRKKNTTDKVLGKLDFSTDGKALLLDHEGKQIQNYRIEYQESKQKGTETIKNFLEIKQISLPSIVVSIVEREGLPSLRGIVYDRGSKIIVRTKDGDVEVEKAEMQSLRQVDVTEEDWSLKRTPVPHAQPSAAPVVPHLQPEPPKVEPPAPTVDPNAPPEKRVEIDKESKDKITTYISSHQSEWEKNGKDLEVLIIAQSAINSAERGLNGQMSSHLNHIQSCINLVEDKNEKEELYDHIYLPVHKISKFSFAPWPRDIALANRGKFESANGTEYTYHITPNGKAFSFFERNILCAKYILKGDGFTFSKNEKQKTDGGGDFAILKDNVEILTITFEKSDRKFVNFPKGKAPYLVKTEKTANFTYLIVEEKKRKIE